MSGSVYGINKPLAPGGFERHPGPGPLVLSTYGVQWKFSLFAPVKFRAGFAPVVAGFLQEESAVQRGFVFMCASLRRVQSYHSTIPCTIYRLSYYEAEDMEETPSSTLHSALFK